MDEKLLQLRDKWDRSAELAIERLCALEDAGDGAIIHDVRHHLHLIRSWRKLTRGETTYADVARYIVFIIRAEDWIKKLAKSL